jgi:hypothetical protein
MAKHNGSDGNLSEYASKKPVAITRDGSFVLPQQAEASFDLGVGSLYSLDTPLQQKLTLERIRLDPKYELGVFGLGKFKKTEVVKHVESLTELGHMVIDAEITYCNEFVSSRLPTETVKPLPSVAPPEVILPPLVPPYKKVKFYVKNTALFVENTTDAVTKLAAEYRIAHVHPAFANRGFKVVALTGVDAVRTKFCVEAKHAFVRHIGGVGHGSPTVYTGHLGNHILEVGGYDPAEVRGKVIHLLSCQTAKQLGSDVVTKESPVYSGYFENFTFVYDNPQTPAVNEMTLFWQADSTFEIAMANGLSAQQAHNATIAAYNAAIAQVPNTSAATWLLWNRNNFRSPVISPIYGEKSTTISPMTTVWITIPLDVTALEMQEEELVRA